MVISSLRVFQRKKISLQERFQEYHSENMAKEFSWDENVGKEIW